MITLLGTSTNLLVDGVAREAGMTPFTLFEIAPVGIAVTLAGIAYFVVIGRKLLPDRSSLASFLGSRRAMKCSPRSPSPRIPAGRPARA